MERSILSANIEDSLQSALGLIHDDKTDELVSILIKVCSTLASSYEIPPIEYRARWLDCMRYLHGLLTKEIDDLDAWLVLVTKFCLLSRYWKDPGTPALMELQKAIAFSKDERLSPAGKQMFQEVVLSEEAEYYCANLLRICISKQYMQLRFMMEWVSRKKISLPICRYIKDAAGRNISTEPWWFIWSFCYLFFGEKNGFIQERVELFCWDLSKASVKGRLGLLYASCWPLARAASIGDKDTWTTQEHEILNVINKTAYHMHQVYVDQMDAEEGAGHGRGVWGGGGGKQREGRQGLGRHGLGRQGLDGRQGDGRQGDEEGKMGDNDLFLGIVPTMDAGARGHMYTMDSPNDHLFSTKVLRIKRNIPRQYLEKECVREGRERCKTSKPKPVIEASKESSRSGSPFYSFPDWGAPSS